MPSAISGSPTPDHRGTHQRQTAEIPDFLDMREIALLLSELELRDRVAVMLVGSTGLRRSEMFARRWRDFDFSQFQANVRDAIVRNVIGECKTEASKKPAALHPLVIAELMAWREVAPYSGDDDFIFASERRDGKTPIAPDMVLKKRIRKALNGPGLSARLSAGIHSGMGWGRCFGRQEST
jgi:integrase